MEVKGNLDKMKTKLVDTTIQYQLVLNEKTVPLNPLIGQQVTLSFQNQINCVVCGKKTNKSFGQGFCFNCFSSAPEAEACILHPEKCQAHLGIARNLEWSTDHCLIDHYVYLAVASGVKVGITRHHQIPTRWIDQGAWKGIILAKTPNRHIAGVIEVFLKNFYSDKTNWRAMLKDVKGDTIDLLEEKGKAAGLLPSELKKYLYPQDHITELNYPVLEYPSTPQSLTFDKQLTIEGILKGIKGQYLLLDQDRVLNIRRHRGYFVSFKG
ncbi:DUF2797 domain-containing protein [Marinilabiliaceae bacterium JC017]|nr:DUF2797 domain-containing protein [Marinilabiliaceae bacterium JC017]